MFNLTGKVILVAGGAGYLALPACKALLGQGAAVAVADLDEERLASAVAELKKEYSSAQIIGLPFDISDESSIKETVARTVAETGGLDVMVNATYGSTAKKLEELTGEEFDKANRINLTGSFLLARESAEAMADEGSIIMFASMYGIVSPDPAIYHAPANPNPVEYGAGKAGVIQLVKYLAAHYGPRNIRVNGIAPGPFPWESLQKADPRFIERLGQKTMLGRIGKRDETAGAVVFLASDEASYVTGHVMRVDGGWTAW